MDLGPISRIKESYKISATNKTLKPIDKNTRVGDIFDKFIIKDDVDIVSKSLSREPYRKTLASTWAKFTD